MNYEHFIEDILRLSHEEEPFTADSFLIIGKKKNYVFDAGADPAFVPLINGIGSYDLIISHFHQDHTGNLKNLTPTELYVSSETGKKFGGTVVTGPVTPEEGITIDVIPTSHTKNALSLKYGDYLFTGDALCDDHGKYNANKVKELIEFLKKQEVKFIIQSHTDRIFKKEEIIAIFEELYFRRKKNEAYIEADYTIWNKI